MGTAEAEHDGYADMKYNNTKENDPSKNEVEISNQLKVCVVCQKVSPVKELLTVFEKTTGGANDHVVHKKGLG